MGFLAGKRALIVGVASERSIASGIAKAMHRESATLAFTYQNDRLKERVDKLAAALGSNIVLPCDVSSDEQITDTFKQLGTHWDGLDIIVHAVAYAPTEEIQGSFVDVTTREGFRIAHDVSSYSFTALARAGRPLMQGRAGALLTLTYLGADRTVPNYNVMGLAKASLEANVRYLAASLGHDGIRVNAISAGPIKTLAAAGIAGFRKMLEVNEHTAPLGRGVTIDEVGNVAAFLCSDLASGVTGEITYVDAGFNTVAFAPDRV
jgi:enoyl-[acyl-carrier protein] reductase I